eukprot:symbB.v1.2.032169.t1/scaffold3815.1/size82879/4
MVLTLEETLKAVKKFQNLVEHVHRLCGEDAPKVKHEPLYGPGGTPKMASDTPRAAAIYGAFSRKETKEMQPAEGELYKPIRLPWRTVSCLTRTGQVMWLGIGIVAALRETNLARFDFQVSYIVEERRLAEESHEILIFEELPVQWPYGSFFRIQALHCIENSTAVSTRFATYDMDSNFALELSPHTRSYRFCGDLGCVDLASRIQWPVQPKPEGHVHISGTLERCHVLERISTTKVDPSSTDGPLCLVLVFEGPGDNEHLKILHAELPAGTMAGEDVSSFQVIHSMDFLPQKPSQLAAFSVSGGLLWILSKSNATFMVKAYDVLQLEPVLQGQWQVQLPEVRLPLFSDPLAMCRHGDSLILAGHCPHAAMGFQSRCTEAGGSFRCWSSVKRQSCGLAQLVGT